MVVTERKTKELHHHRWSAPEIRYFVTMCICARRSGLIATGLRDLILGAVRKSDSIQDTATFAFTVMPDHIHWLFRLGQRLSLGRVVGKFKRETRVELANAGLDWQRDFFEHRLRPEEGIEGYGRYIFLNPYRADLLKLNTIWPGWWCPNPAQFEFLAILNRDGFVPREWLGAEETIGEDAIQAGRD
jgi:REP element-mobilizing transposase RayT